MDASKMPLDIAGLSVRSQNALLRAGYRTVGDLMDCSEEQLGSIRNLGKKSVDEILNLVHFYKNSAEKHVDILDEARIEKQGRIVDFDAWILDEDHKKIALEYMRTAKIKIAQMESLSTKAYNLLLIQGLEDFDQIVFMTEEQLSAIPRMDKLSMQEIQEQTALYLSQLKDNILVYAEQKNTTKSGIPTSTLLFSPEYQTALKNYIRVNDVALDNLGLTRSVCKKLKNNGYRTLLDIAFVRPSEMRESISLSQQAIEEINEKIEAYLLDNWQRIHSLCAGDMNALWDDESIRNRIVGIYNRIGFEGLSLSELIEKIHSPVKIDSTRMKKIVGGLIQEGTLEYVDYRCYRIYPKFEAYLVECHEIDPRNREIVQKRLQGITLEAVAQEYGLTRERVRQIVKAQVQRVRNLYIAKTGMQYFDEDYYQYLYTQYALEKRDSIQWLGISQSTWKYLETLDLKQGKKELKEALEDKKIEASLRLKIKNFLNRNKLYIDETWVEKKREKLEELVVRKFCQQDTTFDQFVQLYNGFLKEEEVPYDEKIYCTEAVYRTRKNRMTEDHFLLWKQNETLRYYDVDGRDYSELLDGLNLDAYENIEVSTEKFIRDYPDLMKRYDIRDRYELHNLLKKIVKDGSYHDFHCCRMPEIRFGRFNREKAILEILKETAPITMPELAEAVSNEYGYDPATVTGTYLQPLNAYYHQGIYTVDQKVMPADNQERLKQTLTEDFYFFDEIIALYKEIIPDADVEEINPFNLKKMGFVVLSRYAVQHYPSLESYCEHLLTCEDMVDISLYRKKFACVVMFSQKLMELKRNLAVIEYEPNKLINIRRLERLGVTQEAIRDFCDQVYDEVADESYFSAASLRQGGFQSELYDLGFGDWFYANLLISDERFSFGNMYGTIILYKGKKDITIKSFECALIQKHGVVDILDLKDELESVYGCKTVDKFDIVYKINGTEVYYDKYLERLYANENLYYNELEESEEA